MSFSRLLGTAIAAFALSFPFYVSAQDDGALPARVKATKKAPAPTGNGVTARGGTGIGIFQDIQVPMNAEYEMRADGGHVVEENGDHMGFPVYGGLTFRNIGERLTFDFVGFEVLKMRATTGPAETQSSSYSRLQLFSGARYRFPLGPITGQVGARLEGRRASFNNVSTNHYIEAALVGGTLGIGGDGWQLDGFAAMAPVARFGYSDATFLGGEAFKKSTATLSEIGFLSAFNLHENTWLDLGAEQEMATATIDDVNEYNGFGLSVQDPRPTRTYDLATSVLRLGIRKEF